MAPSTTIARRQSQHGRRSINRWLVWSVYAMTLIAAPLLFKSSLALTLLSQAGYLIIICLSYNILLGQGGMLSFGHAVYSGLGTYLAIHAMNLAGSEKFVIPLSLVPLVGGISGLFFSALLGYLTTRKAGTTFAMISLGIGEMVFAVAVMFPGFFGGEGGITTNRVYGEPVLGITFGPQIEVYYLIAAYCFCCTAAIFALTRTPLGRMLNAVRDNPERAEFIGYNSQQVRYYSFMIAGFFAGIGGGLAAINLEIVTAEAVGSVRSGNLLLFTFLGGTSYFFGPIIGACLMVLALGLLSELSLAWLLYLGLGFVVMVMYAPGGLASLLMVNLRLALFGKLHRLWTAYLAVFVSALVSLLSAIALTEMVYHQQLKAAIGPELHLFGLALDTARPATWLFAVFILLIGLGLLEFARRRFALRWNAIKEEIVAENSQGKVP